MPAHTVEDAAVSHAFSKLPRYISPDLDQLSMIEQVLVCRRLLALSGAVQGVQAAIKALQVSLAFLALINWII